MPNQFNRHDTQWLSSLIVNWLEAPLMTTMRVQQRFRRSPPYLCEVFHSSLSIEIESTIGDSIRDNGVNAQKHAAKMNGGTATQCQPHRVARSLQMICAIN